MATDYTDEWVNLFRKHGNGLRIPDSMYLKVGLAFGKPVQPSELDTIGKYYRKPDVKTVKKLLRSMEENQKKNSVSPGEAVGLAAAHSMAESYTQKTLRTFHYAGLVGTLSPGKDIDNLVGLTQSMPTRYIVALAPEYRMNRQEAVRLANKITRWKLDGNFEIDVTLGFETNLSELEELINEFPDERKYKRMELDDPLLIAKKERLGSLYDEQADNYHPYEFSEEFTELIAQRNEAFRMIQEAITDNQTNNFANVVSIIPKFKGVSEIPEGESTYFMDLDSLKEQLELMLVDASGDRKVSTVSDDWSFANIEIVNSGDKITVSIPTGTLARRAKSSLALSYQEILKETELCSGCGNVLCSLSVGRVKDRTERYDVVESISETARDHYANVLTTLETEVISDEIDFGSEDYLEGQTRKNPPLEGKELDKAQTSASAMVKVKGSPDDLFFSLKERYPNWRNCQECGGGWWNTAASIGRVKEYDIQTLDEALAISTDDYDTQRANSIFANLEGSNENLPNYPFAWKDHQFEPPSPDVDYDLRSTLIDLLPSNPMPGEYYIEALPKESTDIWKGSIYCSGHFSHITGQYVKKKKKGISSSSFTPPTFTEADPKRSLTTNVQQVLATLGIEAARQMLYQSLAQLYTGGQWLKGFDMRIADRHMMLVADNFTNTGKLLGAPPGIGSLSGLNSAKGLRGNQSAVLARATYEQPTAIILKKTASASQMNTVDPLIEPMSAQIVGSEMKMGTGMHFENGKYNTEFLYNSLYATQYYDACYSRLLRLFQPEGLSLQAAENIMKMSPTDKLYPKRVFESEDYKEAVAELKEAKIEYEKYHGRVVEVLRLDEMLAKANSRKAGR